MLVPQPPPRGAHDPARQRFLLRVTIAILVATAVLILVLPLRLPRPLRLTIAGLDLIAAAVIWALARQRFGK